MSQSAHRLGVAGNPIAHSLSPDIHQAFAVSLGDDVVYERYLFDRDDFGAGAAAFFQQQGGTGLNVTVPFKRDAYEFADRLDALAAAAGAVNTLALQDGNVVGYNTDGVGMVRDIQIRYGEALGGLNALILGAGGACRGVIQPLFDAGIGTIRIANRTLANAQALVDRFDRDYPDRIDAVGFDQLADDVPEVQLIVNSTSSGLSQNNASTEALPEGLQSLSPALVTGRLCYDLSYGEQAHFARWAATQGARLSADGLGMLVEQAAESYRIWLGQRPNTESVYESLRRKTS
mgnify:FL=1